MSKVMKDLLEDFQQKEFTDCMFMFKENESVKILAAHKTILAVASPVFKATFYGDLKADGPVQIMDIPFEVFQKMIWIVYGKSVTVDSPKEACQLYYAAQKYDLPEPLAIARSYMLKNMNATTATEYHNATILFDDTEITQSCCANLFEKIFNTTKIDGFFGSTEPLIGENTFALEQLEDGKALQATIGDYLDKFKKEKNLDMEGLIVKTLELIRILTSEAKKAFELIIPDSMGKFTCFLSWIPSTKTSETFHAACLKKITSITMVRCYYGHENLCLTGVSINYCLQCGSNIISDYSRTSQLASKYGTKDSTAYTLADLKIAYEKMKKSSFL